MKLSDLPIGAKVEEHESGMSFLVAAQNHPGYDGTTLISDKIIAQACLDVVEPDAESKRIAVMGRADYELSNLHQWLNADGPDWYRPAHPADKGPSHDNVLLWKNMYDNESYNPYEGKPGFLSVFGDVFKSSVYESAIAICKHDGSRGKIKARVFLPSIAELGIRAHVGREEGHMLPLFSDFRMRFAMPSAKCLAESDFKPANFRLNDSFQYWLRSAHPRDEGLCAAVHASNPYTYFPAARPWNGVRPMMNLDGGMNVQKSDTGRFWIA